MLSFVDTSRYDALHAKDQNCEAIFIEGIKMREKKIDYLHKKTTSYLLKIGGEELTEEQEELNKRSLLRNFRYKKGALN